MKLRALLWVLPLTFFGVFYLYPLSAILSASFARNQAGALSPFFQALHTPALWKIVAFTFQQAALSTLLTLLVGLPGAYILARYNFPGKTIFRALTGIPFVLPTLIAALAFDSLLGTRGWLNSLLMTLFQLKSPPIQFSQTFTAILVAHVFYNTTIVLRVVGDFWSHLDARLASAARVLGANQRQTFLSVVLPLLTPAITAAGLLVFLFTFTSFGVILVLGGPRFATLETEIYYQTSALFDLPYAATLSLLQIFFTLALTGVYSHLSARVSRPIHLQSQQHIQRPLHTWRRRVAAAVILGSILLLLTLPLFSLGLRSFLRLERERGQTSAIQRGLTLDNYRRLGENPQQSLFYVSPATSIGISLAYASAVVVLSLALGLPTAWLLAQSTQGNRWHATLNRFFDSFIMLPLGTSAVTLGLGFVVAFNRPPLNLGASPLLIPLAHTLVAFPFVVRSLTPALRSVQPRLRQAAALLGASPRQVMLKIDFPLVGRAILAAATFAFTISLGEFGATALLSRPEYPTVPVAIYRFLGRPGETNYGQALALSAILMLVCTLGMLFIERLRLGDSGEF